jgi:hypothetical protein
MLNLCDLCGLPPTRVFCRVLVMPVTDAPDIDLLRRAFVFLLSMGFREIEATPWPGQGGILTYASSKVRVKVSLSRPNCEADVDLGLVKLRTRCLCAALLGLRPTRHCPHQ